MRLIEMEIARRDWQRMICGCGKHAGHLAENLLRLAGHGPSPEPSHVSFEEHVWSPVGLREPAPVVASVALAALAGDMDLAARQWFLDLLHSLVAGEGTDWVSAGRGLDLPKMCQDVAVQGMWLLYEEVMSNRSVNTAGTAFEILTVVEPDRDRLQRVREIAAAWLPVCCRTGLCDEDFDRSDGSR
ncbi:hypothetical protein [Peterkaempfera sp. SMS 1(5)a]|uniref:hypothetical protein n=1 Tax=Peterkaempfera podocarpi TaxID=3232308 RepID=UPI00366E8EB7